MVLEVCVGDVESALGAARAHAHRLEVCDALSDGGTTPSIGTVKCIMEGVCAEKRGGRAPSMW